MPTFDALIAPQGLLAWAGTYLLHSTLLLGVAWGASRLLGDRRLRLQETLWKSALVGALVTATLQTGAASLAPPSGSEAAAGGIAAAAPIAPLSAAETAAPAASTRIAVARELAAAAPATELRSDPRLARLSALLPGWQRLALGVWAIGAVALLSGLGLRWSLLRRRLRRREELVAGAPRRLLDRLLATAASRRRVRLTGSSELPVPIALGVGEREICLPRRALGELDDRRQEGLLAHELAHLERRDPAWLLLALTLERALFFQPLNRVARRRLEEIAELQCDACAVRWTGDRVGLARCLTEVAGWLLEGRGLGAASAPGAAAMASHRGRLGVRVRRILAGGGEDEGRRWLPAAAAVGVLALALAVPGFAPESLASSDVAPGAEAVQETEGEREAELRAHREADAGIAGGASDADRNRENGSDPHGDSADDYDYDFDIDPDFDFDFDFDFEEMAEAMAEALESVREGFLDPGQLAELEVEMQHAVAEAMAALPELMAAQEHAMAEMHHALAELDHELALEGHDLSPEDREEMRREIEREMEHAREEMRRAMEEVRPQFDEARAMQHEISVEMREEMRRAAEEIARAQRELRHESRDEIREEMREAHEEMREAREEIREVREEARREVEESRREAERELVEARREIERARRELDRERVELERARRALEEERRGEPPV